MGILTNVETSVFQNFGILKNNRWKSSYSIFLFSNSFLIFIFVSIIRTLKIYDNL